MPLPVFAIADIRDSEHPFHSATLVPWMVVTLGGLFAELTEVYCECGQMSMQRRYLSDKLALIGPIGSGPEDQNQKDAFLASNTVELFQLIQTASAWVNSGPITLRSIQSNFPKPVREYFSRAGNALSYPFAPHSAVIDGDYKVLAHLCPQCRSLLPTRSARANLTLLVTTGSDDSLYLPIPIICTL